MSKTGWKEEPNVDELVKFVGKGNIEAGILPDAPDYPNGTKLAVVGLALEKGGDSGNPPPQNWLQKSLLKDRKFYDKRIVKILKKPKGPARDALLKALARDAVERIQGHIEKNDIGLNIEETATQEAKGGSSPLIDSQHLIRHIDSRLVP